LLADGLSFLQGFVNTVVVIVLFKTDDIGLDTHGDFGR
jgi:hypothetical protein